MTGGCLFRSDKVRIVQGADQPSVYRRTPDSGSHRKFCKSCGSTLFNDHPGIGMIDVMAVQVPELEFKPRLHTNYAEKVVSVYDGLPKYKYFDPALHGSGEEIPE